MVDLVSYSGLWHEIFKIPFKWESGCVASTAEYTFVKNDKMLIKNTCYLEDGKNYSRRGFALPDINNNNEKNTVMQKLVIEFDDGKKSDCPSPYWIHYTDYYFSVVGGPTDDYLWLLSRKPQISKRDLNYFRDYVYSLGYDIDRVFLQKNVKVFN